MGADDGDGGTAVAMGAMVVFWAGAGAGAVDFFFDAFFFFFVAAEVDAFD